MATRSSKKNEGGSDASKSRKTRGGSVDSEKGAKKRGGGVDAERTIKKPPRPGSVKPADVRAAVRKVIDRQVD